jgi:undecaprenyl-phosphate 4-deoxy-4-formamido-L-arabinose transferase
MQHDPRAATTPVPDVSIVVPVYNSAATLASLIQRLTMVLDQEPETYEIVLVDDGSADDSWPVLQRLRAQSGSNLVTIQLMRNYGQHNALMCGLRHAQGRVVVTMDDDLQNPPEEIPKLLRHLQASNADLVYGAPEDRNHAPWRNLGAALVLHFYRLVFKTPITPTPFRAMRRELVDSVKFYDLNYTFLDGLLAWCTRRVENVTVEHHARAQGRSGYSISRLLTMALNLYTNFSLLPLQLVSVLGLVASAAGLAAAGYYVLQSLTSHIAVPGYASTIVAILLLGGVQLLALGIMGEYLGRLHMNVNKKPQYLVRQQIQAHPGAAGLPAPATPAPACAGTPAPAPADPCGAP